jgi:hypothetical protein
MNRSFSMNNFPWAISVVAGMLAAGSAQAQDAWGFAASCIVTAPAAAQNPELSVALTKKALPDGTVSNSAQIRIRTAAEVVANGARIEGARVSVDQATEFPGLSGLGNSGNVMIVFVPDLKILPAISRGQSLSVTIPVQGETKEYTFPLSGSGKAVANLTACR